jgi:hypothetical protein
MLNKALLIGTLLFGWACPFAAHAQSLPVKHSVGLILAPVLYSTGDRWGKSLGVQYEAEFGQKQTLGLVGSFSLLQKSIGGNERIFGSATMSAHYVFDIGAKLSLRILGGGLSFQAGYGAMWGHEILSGAYYLTIFSASSPRPHFYLTSTRPTFSGGQTPTLRNVTYQGAVYQLQYEHPLSRKLALGGHVKIRYMSRSFPTENNQVNTFGLLIKYTLN